MGTNSEKKTVINGEEDDSLQDASAEMRQAFRNALASWRASNPTARPPVRPAQPARPFRRGIAPVAARPPQFPGTSVSGRPFFIRALTWIAFWTIVVLFFRLLD